MSDAMPNIVAILQARTGSTRLPRKVLAPLLGKPMLWVILKRLEPAARISKMMVATSTQPKDDVVEAIAADCGVKCFRGSEDDCQDRYYQAAKGASADVVVRVTGDNPFVDGSFADWMIDQYLSADNPCDYASPELSGTFPVGLKAEVFSFAALRTAWVTARAPEDREHVTPFLYKVPGRFRVQALSNEANYSHMRWTVDTLADLGFAQTVFAYFGQHLFPWQAVAEALSRGAISDVRCDTLKDQGPAPVLTGAAS